MWSLRGLSDQRGILGLCSATKALQRVLGDLLSPYTGQLFIAMLVRRVRRAWLRRAVYLDCRCCQSGRSLADRGSNEPAGRPQASEAPAPLKGGRSIIVRPSRF
jgi:hypothetical protein